MRSACLLLCILTSELAAQTQSLESLFPRDRIIEVAITIDEDDWDTIRHQTRTFVEALAPERQWAPIGSPYNYVKANVTIDGVAYSNVGVRKKGFIGSLDTQRPSLKIKLDKYVPGRDLQGLSTLTFNNNKQDRSLMSQFIGYNLFNRADSPAPRCALAHITVNGINLGVYAHVESVREPLLERCFGSASGTLFEGTVVDFVEEWENGFECKTGDIEAGREHLLRLINALKAPIDLDAIWAVVDEASFYRFWAVEGLLSFWDGYSGNRNNFFVYLNPTTSKFHFIPWGADCMFETYSQLGEDRAAPRSVRTTGLLAHRLYQLPEVRKAYRAEMRLLLDTIWNEDVLLAKTERVEAMARPLMTSKQKRMESFDKLRAFIKHRRSAIEPELDGMDMPKWNVMPDPPPVIGGIVWKKGTLVTAAKDGDIALLQEHLDNGANVNKPSRDAGSVLGVAAYAGQVEAMKLLIKHGADVNIANGDGNTPLHGAAFFGEVDAVKILLDADANPNPQNNNGETPLDSSGAPWGEEIKGVVEFIARLVNLKVDLEEVKAGRPQAVEILRKHGGKFGFEIPKPEGETIWVAAKSGDLKTLQKYLDDGIDPNQRDDKSITPLCWAAMAGQIDAARLLIDRGADLNHPNGDGGTPLHGAAFFGRTPMVKLLLEKGANVKARNDKGESPLDNVTIPWNQEIAGIMLWIGGVLEIEVNPAAAHAAWPKIADLLR